MTSTTSQNLPAPEPLLSIEQLPIAYYEVDAQGVVRFANAAARQQLAPSDGALVGREIWEFMAPGEVPGSRKRYAEMMQGGDQPLVVRHALFKSRGEYRTQEFHRLLLHDSGGKPCGAACLFFDVSDAVAELAEVDQSRRWLQSTLDATANAVIVIDTLGLVRCWNASAEALLGWTAEQMTGELMEERLAIRCSQEAAWLRLDGTLSQRWTGVVDVIHRDRHSLTLHLTASPVADCESGSMLGVAAIFRRIDEAVDANLDEGV